MAELQYMVLHKKPVYSLWNKLWETRCCDAANYFILLSMCLALLNNSSVLSYFIYWHSFFIYFFLFHVLVLEYDIRVMQKRT